MAVNQFIKKEQEDIVLISKPNIILFLILQKVHFLLQLEEEGWFLQFAPLKNQDWLCFEHSKSADVYDA